MTEQDERCPCSRAVEKRQQASLFGRMQHLQEQAQLLEQVMAEVATIPYLQDLSQEDIQLVSIDFFPLVLAFRGREPGKGWGRTLCCSLLWKSFFQCADLK